MYSPFKIPRHGFGRAIIFDTHCSFINCIIAIQSNRKAECQKDKHEEELYCIIEHSGQRHLQVTLNAIYDIFIGCQLTVFKIYKREKLKDLKIHIYGIKGTV